VATARHLQLLALQNPAAAVAAAGGVLAPPALQHPAAAAASAVGSYAVLRQGM
jgi:hypothetical protein